MLIRLFHKIRNKKRLKKALQRDRMEVKRGKTHEKRKAKTNA